MLQRVDRKLCRLRTEMHEKRPETRTKQRDERNHGAEPVYPDRSIHESPARRTMLVVVVVTKTRPRSNIEALIHNQSDGSRDAAEHRVNIIASHGAEEYSRDSDL